MILLINRCQVKLCSYNNMQCRKMILFTGIWFIIVFAQFSSKVRHAYIFVFKDEIKNSLELSVMLYASRLIVKDILQWGCGTAGNVLYQDTEDLGLPVSCASLLVLRVCARNLTSLKPHWRYNDVSAYDRNLYVCIKARVWKAFNLNHI